MIEQGEDWAAGIIPGTDAPAFTMLHAAGSPIPVVVADEPAPEPMTMQSVWDGQNRETRNVICGYFLAQPGPTLDQLVSAGNGMFGRDAIMIFLEEKCR